MSDTHNNGRRKPPVIAKIHQIEKTLKKNLTKGGRCGILNKSPDEGGAEDLRNRVAVGKVTNLEN